VNRAEAALDVWIETRRRAVDAALERYLPDDSRAPHIICEAMRYSVLAGGKRLRPLLVLAAAEAVGERAGVSERVVQALALPAACAVEMIHTYSLVHDDLPSMDNDTLRRGRPTAHVVFGEGMAILSGDGLLTEAFALMAREPDLPAGAGSRAELAARRLEALRVIADAAGAEGMVGGQAIDLHAARPGAAPLDAASLRGMHARKTGALIRGSAMAGAILAGAESSALEAVRAYASQLGLAFQIVDDILDVEGASAELGKTAGKDAAAGKVTYPSMFGLDESRRLAAECAARAVASLESARLHGQLPAIARWVVGRSQ
jgi:geranylgeranyl diphosphate synthase type II